MEIEEPWRQTLSHDSCDSGKATRIEKFNILEVTDLYLPLPTDTFAESAFVPLIAAAIVLPPCVYLLLHPKACKHQFSSSKLETESYQVFQKPMKISHLL